MANHKAQRAVDVWNANYPIGTPVHVVKRFCERVITKTRSEAWVLSGHTAVIMLEGISGCYALDHVNPLETDSQ